MRRIVVLLAFVCCPAAAQVVPGHRLPEGPERPVRDREIHIERYRADLKFDMPREEISGNATIALSSMRSGLTEVALDAAGLDVTGATASGSPAKFQVDRTARAVRITLPRPLAAGEKTTVGVTWSVHPKTGMYFFPATRMRAAQAWNYGEGGLHDGWLPIYNDVNDKFAVDLAVTVAKPYSALANGVLTETRENSDGTRTFHKECRGICFLERVQRHLTLTVHSERRTTGDEHAKAFCRAE